MIGAHRRSLRDALLFALSLAFVTDGEAMAPGSAEGEAGVLIASLQACHKLPDKTERLACYDRLARDNKPPDYAGKLGFRTPPFAITRPTRLRYRSQGVIFVLYVLNEKGEVLQNLHLGGGGEGNYVIEEAGRYSLQIDGSARWQLWLESLETTREDVR